MKNILETLEDTKYKIMCYDDHHKKCPAVGMYFNTKAEAETQSDEYDPTKKRWVVEFTPKRPTHKQMKMLRHLNEVGYDTVINCSRIAGYKPTESRHQAWAWYSRGWVKSWQSPNPRKPGTKQVVNMICLLWVSQYWKRFGTLPNEELIKKMAS